MRGRHRHYWGATVAVLIFALFQAWYATDSYWFGVVDAELAYAIGQRQVLVYGYARRSATEEFALAQKRLKTQYGISNRRVAFCLISRSYAAYCDGYNETVHRRLCAQYGFDPIEREYVAAQYEVDRRIAEPCLPAAPPN